MQATTVAAQGEAETEYDLVQFNISLNNTEKTVPKAKAKLKGQVDELLAAVEMIQKTQDVHIIKGSLRTNTQVNERREWNGNEQVFKGYTASYSMSFQLDDLTKITGIYDALTSLKEVSVSQPSLMLKNREIVNKAALAEAYKKVSDRFATECGVFGLSPDDFQVETWEVSYSDSRRSDRVGASMMRSMSANDGVLESAMGGAPDTSIEIVAGNAKVTVNLEVGFAKKAR